jgi:hypothetical protein
LQLRLFQTMGEIAVNQNSTIVLPVPVDLLRPYLDSSRDGYGASAQQKSEGGRREERRYEETIREASREVPGGIPDGEANP